MKALGQLVHEKGKKHPDTLKAALVAGQKFVKLTNAKKK